MGKGHSLGKNSVIVKFRPQFDFLISRSIYMSQFLKTVASGKVDSGSVCIFDISLSSM